MQGDLFVQFDPTRPRSFSPAAAGAELAQSHHGAFTSAVRQQAMWFDIPRPVREMRLAEPFSLGGLPVALIDVRTLDYGDSSAIPDATADPNEITVTARRSRGPVYRTLLVGADALAPCSTLEFDKPAGQIRLSCAL
jgi:hypothetical protein